MNFKSLALSALVALSTFGGVAQAAPTTCALRDSRNLHEFTCDHVLRTNANGHNVNDITFFDNGKRYELSIIFWMTDGSIDYAEVFTEGRRMAMDAYKAKNGSWCISNEGYQLCVH